MIERRGHALRRDGADRRDRLGDRFAGDEAIDEPPRSGRRPYKSFDARLAGYR
jgi:hypothetical protein